MAQGRDGGANSTQHGRGFYCRYNFLLFASDAARRWNQHHHPNSSLARRSRTLSSVVDVFGRKKLSTVCRGFSPHQKGVVVSSDRMCASLTLLLLRHELFRVHIVQFMIILRQVVGVPTFFLAVGATCFHSLIYHGHFSQSAYGVSS